MCHQSNNGYVDRRQFDLQKFIDGTRGRQFGVRGSAVIGPRRHRAMDALATYVSDDDERSVDAGVDAEREALALSGVGHS